MIVAILVIFGLCLGSFVNALVWRLHQQKVGQGPKAKSKELSILHGRSMCPSCGHELAALDLIPVISWLGLRGRCRYCAKPISWQYPAVELAAALVFVGSYLFWPGGLHGAGKWVWLITWLVSSVGLLALAVYDFCWMLLPSRILYPTLLVAVVGRLVYLLGYEPHKLHALVVWAATVAVASGIFFGLFVVSNGRWIGYGDVRLGLITGTLLADPSEAFLMILLASFMGTLFVLPELLQGKKTADSKLPYGPFLIAATALVLLFGHSLINWYQNHWF